MPIPKPRPKEKQAKYISRCHDFLYNENKTRKPKRSKEQISAICFGIWRKKDYSETQTKEIVKWYEELIGMPKKDGSGKGIRANKGRGGHKPKKKGQGKLDYAKVVALKLAARKGEDKKKKKKKVNKK